MRIFLSAIAISFLMGSVRPQPNQSRHEDSNIAKTSKPRVTDPSRNQNKKLGGNNGERGLSPSFKAVANHQGCGEGLRKIVRCQEGVPEEVCRSDLVREGINVVADLPRTPYFAVCVGSDEETNKVLQLVGISEMEDDVIRTPSVVGGSEQRRDLQSSDGQVIPYGVEMVGAPTFWSTYNRRGAGVKVCIIDSGLQATHEDIREAPLTGSDKGYPDLVNPWSRDGDGHGNHVIGTISAQDNPIGVVGVAPEASVHVVRVFGEDGSFSGSNLIEALTACSEAGADIISMSLGGPAALEAEQRTIDLLRSQGILMIAAAGNDAEFLNAASYPAAYSDVVSVAAVNPDSRIASFSTHNDHVDVSGPGVDVLSIGGPDDTSYFAASGTSMATPHVSGVAALLWSLFPNQNASAIRRALEESARDVGACGKDPLFGNGVVDAMAAASYLQNGSEGAAAESSDCIGVGIRLQTDDYGQETTYLVRPKGGDFAEIVYRGGPYPNFRAAYENNLLLPNGCYTLILLDSYGDGTNDPSYGVGKISVSYAGVEQISFDDFGGYEESFDFGNCAGDTPGNDGSDASPPPKPDGDFLLLQMTLQTDEYPLESVFLLESDDRDRIWDEDGTSFMPYTEYNFYAWVPVKGCTTLDFTDTYGDGLFGDGYAKLILDGDIIFKESEIFSGFVWKTGRTCPPELKSMTSYTMNPTETLSP